jgi:hypothetical protein
MGLCPELGISLVRLRQSINTSKDIVSDGIQAARDGNLNVGRRMGDLLDEVRII